MTAGVHGDARLAERLAGLLGPRHPVAAAATVTSAGVTVAARGAALDAGFEIASISKGITGMLYADALARGEVGRETTLGELLPLGDVPAARVTLDALSTHRSGLPRLPASAQPLRRTIALWRHGTNPYGEDLARLLAQARGVTVGKPAARYSNFGFELLGHAVASAAGTTYAELLAGRIAEPLGLAGLYVPAVPAQLRETALTGRSRRGRPREPWTGEAIGPAGGIRASIGDMARLAAALLDGSAPGVAALDPVAPFAGRSRIGAGWITTSLNGRDITWHNGGSGGFRSWLGLDRAAGTGVVVLSATSASVDRHGFRLLTEVTGTAA
ncbi:CubicO group peptidase (beta-lactamase class C family) [Thermocatellispora tengchongensis]|uniref:CubicO group peptidase (Beta-lactamase class C family) n=1 Tax=Thermocatellispora tengchongensis TaxID=1073253 RepID=A0A840NYV3_9ACTN|nr:serine hydrolase domain-containing protein [Thermocatellispora tengchongensis]MBB5131386.1 CubicO group peptidase (beta-lactamase class C family) [Thermocatellispora tengchongensis]